MVWCPTCTIQNSIPILAGNHLPKGNHICIDIQQQHEKMPIGDQLASVVLALANDSLIDQEIHTLARHMVDE